MFLTENIQYYNNIIGLQNQDVAILSINLFILYCYVYAIFLIKFK